jgi:biopolymer transport protein TolR
MTASGNTGEMSSSINVTPMIDILLVLLIIFMVIVPAVPRGEAAMSPRPSTKHASTDPNAVVLEVLKGRGAQTAYRINQQNVAISELPARLAAIYANRAERVLFVKGDDALSFTEVAKVIDISHAAGVDHVGLMTPGSQSSQ